MHRHSLPAASAPRVVGLDDWAWKKGRSYGAICVDLERHQPIDLLPDREPATIAAWLQAHPTIEVVARDRGGAFIDGVRQGAPQAIQVADRWHLLKNLGDALEQLFHHQSSVLKQVFAELDAQQDPIAPQERTVPTLDGASVSRRNKEASAEWSNRACERYREIHALHAEKIGVTTIARLLNLSRPTVYRYLQMPEPPTPSKIAVRERHVVDPWKPYLVQQWNAGCRNALLLWRDIRDNHGYTHSPRTVARFVEVLRRDSGTPRSFRAVASQSIYAVDAEQKRPLTALQAQQLWQSNPDQRSAWLERYRRALCKRHAGLAHAYTLTQRFCEMVRQREGDKLDDWLTEAHASGVAQLVGFAKGLERDYAAVKAGLTLEWSNGQTEAQVHRLKLLKRQTYGQAGFDLLRKRVLHRDPPVPVHRRNAQEHAKTGHDTATGRLLRAGSSGVNRPSERSYSRKADMSEADREPNENHEFSREVA
jgi:transposase